MPGQDTVSDGVGAAIILVSFALLATIWIVGFDRSLPRLLAREVQLKRREIPRRLRGVGREDIVSTLHHFDSDQQVRVPRKAFEAAVPAIFRSDEILEAAGVKVNKTHFVGPLSAWRFLREDPDAIKFAKEVGVDPRTKSCTVRNTDALRLRTLPWVGQGKETGKKGFAPIYADEKRVPDPLTLRMVRPVK